LIRPLPFYLEERFIVMRYEKLMSGLIRFGQGTVHDFIVRSNDVNDAVASLYCEVGFDLARVSSFKTINLTHAKINQKEG
jgi:hypothetical protein